MASEALARRLTSLLLAGCLLAATCSGGTEDVTVTWKIEPIPPVANTATMVRVTLQHRHGQPIAAAKLRLEAHMSHPGMTPVTAAVDDRGDGTYEARLHLSMAGDWILVVSGQLANGRRLTREIPVTAVKSTGAALRIP